MQEQFKVALQLAAEELGKTEAPGSLPLPAEVAQLVEEAMFGFYGALRYPLYALGSVVRIR